MATAERVETKQSKKRTRSGSRKARSHKLRNAFLTVLFLSGVVVYFAPAIVARTPLRNWMVQTAVAPNGTITLGSASLGWFSPIGVDDLQILDDAGDTAVAIESFSSEKSLIAILLDLGDLGQLHVTQPAVHLVAYEKDTNLERIFASLLTSEGESSVTAKINVTNGTVVVDDMVDSRRLEFSNLAAECALGDATGGILLAVSGTLDDEQQPGSFKIDLRTTGSDAHGPLAAGKITCSTTALPLEALDPLLRRIIDDAQLTGRLSTDLQGAWGDMAEDGETSIDGNVTLTNLNFAAAAIGPDEIRLDRVDMPCRIRQKGEQVDIDELAIRCELGNIALVGSFKISDFSEDDVLAALARENYELKGQVDLAKLARMLPDTLMIREGTEITAGRVDLAASAKKRPSGSSWTGLVETSRLAGTANGRPIAWEKPLTLQFAAVETNAGIVIDRAVCTSDFLKVDAAGSLRDMSASAEFDLARMVTELRQFSDLNNIQLAGQGRARLTFKRSGKNGFSADANFQAEGFQWITERARPWTENRLVARLTLNGQFNGQLDEPSIEQIGAAWLTIDSGADQLDVQLTSAVTDLGNATWPLECSWRGKLDVWPARLEACLGLTGWNLAGAGTMQAKVNASPKAISVEELQTELSQLRVGGNGWFINEPVVTSTLAGQWDVATGRIDVASAKVSAGTAVAVVDRAVLQPSDAGWTLDDGKVRVEGELAQFARWRQDPRSPAAWHVSGRLTSDTQLKHADGATTATVDAAVDNLQVVDAARPATPGGKPVVWQEPRITLSATGNYLYAEKQLKLDSLQVASNALRLAATGVVAAGQEGGSVDLQGNVGYDWAQLSPLLQRYLGQDFRIAGRQTREFSVRGQLTGPLTSADSWKQINGQAALGWTAIDVFGLRVGQGDIAAELANGQLRTQPIDMGISEGRLTISPVARLTPAPAELFLSSGPLLTNVRLSPELCARGLRFVTPLLAGATVAEGTFSIVLDGGRLPLADPTAGDISGRMAMRGQIKPGIIAREFVGIIKELVTILQNGTLPNLDGLDGSLVSVDNSNIEFRMVNGRVYHRGLTITIGTTPVTTEGSVGFDETLSLVAEVPIRARLLGADLSLGALEGRTLKIPIGGTLKKPKLDRRALGDIPRQLIESAARNALTDGLNKGLERLFNP